MTDTTKASWITDHPFEPRTRTVIALNLVAKPAEVVLLPPNSALCQHCRTAEAAHQHTTSNSLSVKRDQEKPDGPSTAAP